MSDGAAGMPDTQCEDQPGGDDLAAWGMPPLVGSPTPTLATERHFGSRQAESRQSLKIAKKVYGHAKLPDTFTPKDTIFASVATENTAPGSMLTAVWTHESGQTVDSTVQPLSSGAPSITEFHLAKPSGWPAGNYKVVILLDGQPAGEKAFVVK